MSDHNQASDKLDLHNRQQLSALMDGALAPDEARFLLRRLQHDRELSECWERWQLAGDVVRGRAAVMLPHGFAERVGTAIAVQAAAASKSPAPPRKARWVGGVALAASVAVVALLATRQAPNTPEQAVSPMAVAAPAPTMEELSTRSTSSPTPVATQPSSTAAAVVTVATADTPRRSAQRVRSVQRATPERPASTPATGIAPSEAVVAAAAESTQASRPFDAGTLPSPRPWPRAVLPQFGTSGALTAGADAGRSPSFYPFEPRLPDEAVETQAGPTQPR